MKEYRQQLRNNMTAAEAALWSILKCNHLGEIKFRRQHSIGNYILDFYCPRLKLAIELDGNVHNSLESSDYDYRRDMWLSSNACITVLRFENRIVFEKPNEIIDAILAVKNSYE